MKVLFVYSGNCKDGMSTIVSDQGISLEKYSIQVHYFSINGKGFFGYLRNGLKLKKYLSQTSYDIIHAHYGLCGLVSILAKGTKEKLVISLMGSDILGIVNYKGKMTQDGRILSKIIQYSTKYADHIIVKSDRMAGKLKQKNLHIIPNGINSFNFNIIEKQEALKKLGWDTRKIHLLFMADPERPEKNFSLTRNAISFLANDSLQLHLLKNIPHNKVNYYYYASDVCLLSSFQEGSPNVIKEAMFCNCPIVSTNVGDVQNLFGNLDGHYISTFEVIDFATKIQKAIDYSKSFGRTSGKIRILELGLDSNSVAKNIIDLYLQLSPK